MRKKRLGKITRALAVLAVPLVAAFGVPAVAYADTTGCAHLDNGDLCITVTTGQNGYHDVTVWYHKLRGPSPVYIDLAYGYDDRAYDNGPFLEYTGQNRGFVWHNQYLSAYCHYALMYQKQYPPVPMDYGTQINGGGACL
jgi:hypothetical protein